MVRRGGEMGELTEDLEKGGGVGNRETRIGVVVECT